MVISSQSELRRSPSWDELNSKWAKLNWSWQLRWARIELGWAWAEMRWSMSLEIRALVVWAQTNCAPPQGFWKLIKSSLDCIVHRILFVKEERRQCWPLVDLKHTAFAFMLYSMHGWACLISYVGWLDQIFSPIYGKLFLIHITI